MLNLPPRLQSLLAKEWAERQATLRWGMVLALLYLGYCVAYEIEYRPRALIASYYTACVMFSCLGAVLLAMSTAAGEYSRRTLKFSASLPVSLRQMAWVRLCGAWCCLAIPILVGALLVSMLLASGLIEQAGIRGETTERLTERASLSPGPAIAFLWTTVAIALVSAAELMALLALIGTRCRTETQVGFWGAVIFLIWFAALPIRLLLNWPVVTTCLAIPFPQSLVIMLGYKDIDGSSYSDLELGPRIWGPLAGSLILTWLIGRGFARRYGSRPETEAAAPGTPRRRWQLPSLLARGSFRLPGKIPALVWLDLRQSLPLCLAGLTLATLITLFGLLENRNQSGPLLYRLAGELPSSTWFVAVLWSALVGVGIFAAELEPGLQHFWRTRPIAPATWFWTKFAVGLLAVLSVLDGIPALVAWKSAYHVGSGRMGFAYLACLPLLHAQIYAMAVAAVCWLRRSVAAAAVALLLFWLIEAIMDSIPGQTDLGTIEVFNKLEADERIDGVFSLLTHNYPLVYGIVISVIILGALIARRGALQSRPEMDL